MNKDIYIYIYHDEVDYYNYEIQMINHIATGFGLLRVLYKILQIE